MYLLRMIQKAQWFLQRGCPSTHFPPERGRKSH